MALLCLFRRQLRKPPYTDGNLCHPRRPLNKRSRTNARTRVKQLRAHRLLAARETHGVGELSPVIDDIVMLKNQTIHSHISAYAHTVLLNPVRFKSITDCSPNTITR